MSSNETDAVDIIQITDTHLYADAAREMRGVNTYASLRRVVSAISTGPVPHAVLATGDLRQDDSAEAYQQFASIVSTIDAPTLALPGNHDDAAALDATLADTAVSTARRHDIGAWRILMLNSAVAGQVQGRLSDDTLDWLAEQLSAADRPVLVALHHPPLWISSPWLDRISLTNAEAFFDVMDAHQGTVSAVIAGHVHQAMHCQRAGVDYFTTPSTSVQFQPGARIKTFDPVTPGFRRLRLLTDGRVQSSVHRCPPDQAFDTTHAAAQR